MTITKCHSERRSVIRFADGGTQSRNLLLEERQKQVSRLRKFVRFAGKLCCARNDRLGMVCDVSSGVHTSLYVFAAGLPAVRTTASTMSSRMPFAGPERALAATISAGDEVKGHPAQNRARLGFSLLRILNHLHGDSTTCAGRVLKLAVFSAIRIRARLQLCRIPAKESSG